MALLVYAINRVRKTSNDSSITGFGFDIVINRSGPMITNVADRAMDDGVWTSGIPPAKIIVPMTVARDTAGDLNAPTAGGEQPHHFYPGLAPDQTPGEQSKAKRGPKDSLARSWLPSSDASGAVASGATVANPAFVGADARHEYLAVVDEHDDDKDNGAGTAVDVDDPFGMPQGPEGWGDADNEFAEAILGLSAKPAWAEQYKDVAPKIANIDPEELARMMAMLEPDE